MSTQVQDLTAAPTRGIRMRVRLASRMDRTSLLLLSSATVSLAVALVMTLRGA